MKINGRKQKKNYPEGTPLGQSFAENFGLKVYPDNYRESEKRKGGLFTVCISCKIKHLQNFR
jgi:hypothetical protein